MKRGSLPNLRDPASRSAAQRGNKRLLRIVLQRGDLQSNLIHPIDSPNFVIAVPLQDATPKGLT